MRTGVQRGGDFLSSEESEVAEPHASASRTFSAP
jgi:hypothetical protein